MGLGRSPAAFVGNVTLIPAHLPPLEGAANLVDHVAHDAACLRDVLDVLGQLEGPATAAASRRRRTGAAAVAGVSSAATSIRRAPSRAISSSRDRPSARPAPPRCRRPSAWVPPPSPRVSGGGGR